VNKNAQSWLKALRSNAYVQTTGFLHRTTTTPFSKIGWCCLGVACDVYQKKVGDLTITQNVIPYELDTQIEEFDGQNNVLPEKVRAWLGLRTSSGWSGSQSLFTLNDLLAWDFYQIAEFIEKQESNLFGSQVNEPTN
jgi:hypothetical protein